MIEKISKFEVAAVIVLYQPDEAVLKNIAAFTHQVDFIFAVDNSESVSPVVADSLKLVRAKHIRNSANVGVAKALNMGAEMAIAAGYNWLLTMDQDSKVTPGMVTNMFNCLESMDVVRIGIISPFHLMTQARKPPERGPECEEVITPMTSGNLLNLRVYKQVGPFRDDLFIDFVDNEYCLRLRKHGFQVIRANRALLQHEVGDTKKYGPFVATNHSPLRRYYKTRNRFLVNRLYRRDFRIHCLIDRVRMIKEIGSIILFEKEKVRKLKMMWRGYLDYRHGRFGKYEDCSASTEGCRR